MINNEKDSVRKDRVTIYEVARVAGVSLATVSRVMNNSPAVTKKTKALVNDVIEQLGYKPSALARGLANSSSTNIGIMIPSTGYSYVSNMLDGMIDVAKIYGYITSIFITKRTKEDAGVMIDSLIRSHVDGAVIYDDELGTDEIRSILNYHVPLVVVGHELSGAEYGSIILDYESPVLAEVENYMKESTRDDIVILDIINQGKMIDQLRDKIIQLGKKYNKNVKTLQLHDSYSIVYDYMKNYFKDNKYGYFICPRDSLATGVVNAAIEANIDIPNDVQVIAEIGNKYSYIVRPQISSFSMDMFKVGSLAMRMLTKLLNGEDVKENSLKMSPKFIKRNSSK